MQIRKYVITVSFTQQIKASDERIMKADLSPDKSPYTAILLGISQVLTMAIPQAARALLTPTAESI